MHQDTILGSEKTRILELGSGAGFLGMLCTRLARHRAAVHLTDLEGSVLDRLSETASLSKSVNADRL